MIFEEAPIKGAYVIRLERQEDNRGFFARSWCREEFSAHSLNPNLAQCSISFNRLKGTIRGLHYQTKPHEEAKLVRCTMGAVFDVIVDLRQASPSRRRWFSVELTVENRTMLYIPEGVAHGFQTLQDNAEVYYQISETYHPECQAGVRWDDQEIGITWPISEVVISDRDKNLPFLKECGFCERVVIS